MDPQFEFKKVKLDKDYRWSYTTMITFIITILLTSICNLLLFGASFSITDPGDSPMFSATLTLLRWVLLVFAVASVILAVLLITLPRTDFQFDWCYRPKDPQDIVDDYGDYDVLSDNPEYKPPLNASEPWKKRNPTPAPTVRFQDLEDSMSTLKETLERKQLRWRSGEYSDPILERDNALLDDTS